MSQRNHLVDDVTEGKVLGELNIWKGLKGGESVDVKTKFHLWTLYIRHLWMCQQRVERVIFSDHLFGCQVLGRVLREGN